MDKFLALSPEKRKAILDAGFATFGRLGYKKASANDIATAAGISKGMIFHYFGSKRAMYFYLLNTAYDTMTDAFSKAYRQEAAEAMDFFDRILKGTQVKLSVLRKHPDLYQFFTSMYFETDPEVTNGVRDMISRGEAFGGSFAMTDFDTSRFKSGVDPRLVWNILIKFAEGYMNTAGRQGTIPLEEITEEFGKCVELMKNNLYKEDYL